MIIWYVIEVAAVFFLPAWWAFAILAIGVFVFLAQSVKEDMEVYEHAWETDREIQENQRARK